MLTFIIVAVIILIFPIFISGKFYFNKNEIKIYYRITLFKFIKIIYGYAELLKDGIILHLTKNKAVLLPYSNIFEIKEKVKPLKDYHLITADLNMNLGSEDVFLPASATFIVNYAYNYLRWFLCHKKPYFKFKNTANVYVGASVFEVKFNGTAVFNLLMIVLSLIKILIGKVYYAIAK